MLNKKRRKIHSSERPPMTTMAANVVWRKKKHKIPALLFIFILIRSWRFSFFLKHNSSGQIFFYFAAYSDFYLQIFSLFFSF